MRSILLLLLIAPSASAQDKIGVTWLGHATFEIVSPGGTRLLIDPFIMGNPATPKARKTLDGWALDGLLVTHAHGDHASDVVSLAKATGAPVVGAHDYVQSLAIPEAQKMGGNVGGTLTIKDVRVHLVPAMHGSAPGGRPLGLVLQFADGRTIYHTGDTWIFGDMALIQELYAPEIILLQTGGGPFNQTPAVAALAIKKYFTPKTIVPMHFGTWPILADEAAVKAAFKGDPRLELMQPGVKQAL